jgi:hypothetical protein
MVIFAFNVKYSLFLLFISRMNMNQMQKYCAYIAGAK